MMRWLLLVALLVLAGALSATAQTDKLPNLITVTGEGEVAVVPDLAVLGAGVTTTGKTAREASEANAKMMTTVMAALKAAGIAEQDVQTSRLSLHPVRDNKNSDLRVTGFQATNQVTVKLRDIAKIADVIDRLVAAGANDISGIQFVVSQPSQPLDKAREEAIADARRKVRDLCQGGECAARRGGEHQRERQRGAQSGHGARHESRRGHADLGRRADAAYFDIRQLRTAALTAAAITSPAPGPDARR
jgi:uncharacterized protein YggE